MMNPESIQAHNHWREMYLHTREQNEELKIQEAELQDDMIHTYAKISPEKVPPSMQSVLIVVNIVNKQ